MKIICKMRVVVQRAKKASVSIGSEVVGAIGTGMVVLAGFEHADTQEDIEWIAGKLARLRIFNDHQGVMNLSIQEVGGEALVVSQFTLHAKTRKGNRPSYIQAAPPEIAIPLYNSFVELLSREIQKPVATGRFGAMMDVSLVNDGPVTIFIDSKNRE